MIIWRDLGRLWWLTTLAWLEVICRIALPFAILWALWQMLRVVSLKFH